MMTRPALCPSCKKDVVFDTAAGVSICSECGASFELSGGAQRKRRARPIHGFIFTAWMFAPAVFGLLTIVFIEKILNERLNSFLQHHQVFPWAFAGVSLISCYASCAWLVTRFTEKVWARVLIGIFFGGGIFLCNLVVVVFAGCVALFK